MSSVTQVITEKCIFNTYIHTYMLRSCRYTVSPVQRWLKVGACREAVQLGADGTMRRIFDMIQMVSIMLKAKRKHADKDHVRERIQWQVSTSLP